MAPAAEPAGALSWEAMETRIRDYFDACNSGQVDRIAAHFEPDAVHYFPPGMYEGPFRGAEVIARRWNKAVEAFGSSWTVDQVICHPPSLRAVIEWTHFKPAQGVRLRGDEWYVFSPTGLIREIRAYYAAPQAPDMKLFELGGFDYAGRGYPLEPG